MPRVALILCTTQRSGSLLLAWVLSETRLAGRPGGYFGRVGRAKFAEKWEAETDADYLAAVLDYATTPNGVFAATIHWHHLEAARRCLQAAPLPDEPFSVLARRVQYAWLRRRDKVRQAVSAG